MLPKPDKKSPHNTRLICQPFECCRSKKSASPQAQPEIVCCLSSLSKEMSGSMDHIFNWMITSLVLLFSEQSTQNTSGAIHECMTFPRRLVATARILKYEEIRILASFPRCKQWKESQLRERREATNLFDPFVSEDIILWDLHNPEINGKSPKSIHEASSQKLHPQHGHSQMYSYNTNRGA